MPWPSSGKRNDSLADMSLISASELRSGERRHDEAGSRISEGIAGKLYLKQTSKFDRCDVVRTKYEIVI